MTIAIVLFCLFLFQTSVLGAWAPDATLVIGNKDLAGDCTIRNSVTINGTSPGPVLRFTAGQHIWIRVYNELGTNTTLHFHGLSQFLSPFADGTPQTSQWPIASGSYFDYEFLLGPDSVGTHMYHSHMGYQLITAYGAFIVEDASPPPYHYDADLPILLGDFYHQSDEALEHNLNAAPFKWIGEPQSLTVNGDALGTCDESTAGASGCSTQCHHHVIEVEADKTYRVRAIGIMSLTYLFMALESHPEFTIIEADAAYLSPTNTSHLEIHSGQRFSFLLKTKSEQELANLGGERTFWGRIESRYRSTRVKGAFLLRYTASANGTTNGTSSNCTLLSESTTPAPANLSTTVTLPDEGNAWADHDFAPLEGSEEPPREEDVTRRIIISAQQQGDAVGGKRWKVNGEAYSEVSPSVPYLIQAYSKPSTFTPNYTLAEANNGYDSSTKTFPVRLNETIEILIENRVSDINKTEAHPWHIHGQHPWLIASGSGQYDPANLTASTGLHSPRKPVLRDTVVVHPDVGAAYTPSLAPNSTASGWLLFRMKATHAGAWLMHCHIASHASMGMGLVLAVGMDELPQLPESYTESYMTFGAPPAVASSYFNNATRV